MAKIKINDLRKKKKSELEKQLNELRKELSQHRIAKVTGGVASKLAKINYLRKSIARVLTVINQTQKSHIRAAYSKSQIKAGYSKKYLPLDLRTKKTRAIRRQLTPNQEHAKTLRQQKRDAHFPQKLYALKA